MSREEILEVVRESLLEILYDIDPQRVTMDVSMKSLGANSLDRSEVSLDSMERLGLDFPARELGGLPNIGALVEVFYQKMQA
jgi:polyketide biosynthesis acyl carrier protein